jgi:hypothetical protein
MLFALAQLFFDPTARSRPSNLVVFPFAVLVQQLVADDMHHMVGLRIVSALLLFQL